MSRFRSSTRANSRFRCQAEKVTALDRAHFIRHSDDICSLDSALQAVDDALGSAAKVKTKTSREVDEKFEKAIEVLILYETECHPKNPAPGDSNGRATTVHERMTKAKTKDKSSSSILNVLKEKLSLKVRLAHTTPPKTVLIPNPRKPRMENQNQRRSSSSFSSNPCLITARLL